MILEVIRMVRDQLASESSGINAQLANLPMDDGDPIPPPVVRVIDPSRADEAATTDAIRDIADWPVVIVDVNTPAEFAGEVGSIYRDGVVTVEIVYITASADTARYVTDTLYTLRAIVRSLRVLLLNENQQTLALRNDVHIWVAESITYGRVDEKLEMGVVTGMVVLIAKVRDSDPNF